MKQRITPEQLQELSDEQRQKLREWWEPEHGDWCVAVHKTREIDPEAIFQFVGSTRKRVANYKEFNFPLLDIGLMIEFLESFDQCLNISKRTDFFSNAWGYEIELRHLRLTVYKTGELVDALWEAVKEVLNEECISIN